MSNILERANKIVNERAEEKERMYGPFEKSMTLAAALYNLMTGTDSMTNVGMCKAMVAMKLAREAFAHKEDNLLDAVAYLGEMNNILENNKNI